MIETQLPSATPYPDLEQIRLDYKAAKKVLRAAGVPAKLITSIETKALRTGRKQKRAKLMTAALRSFLHYARYLGAVTLDLAAAVPMHFAGIPLATTATVIFISRIGDVLGVLLSGPLADLCEQSFAAEIVVQNLVFRFPQTRFWTASRLFPTWRLLERGIARFSTVPRRQWR
jgi:hypothetical protein